MDRHEFGEYAYSTGVEDGRRAAERDCEVRLARLEAECAELRVDRDRLARAIEEAFGEGVDLAKGVRVLLAAIDDARNGGG